MKIAFSARGLSVPSGGVREFISSLIPALARQRGNDELFIFYNGEQFAGLAPDCSEIVIKGGNRIWWDFVVLPSALRKLRADAIVFPKNVIPYFVGGACYVVVHDLAYFVPELGAYPLPDTVYMRTFIPRSVRTAAGVFAVSENTKQDIIRYTGCDSERVTVAHEAADEIYRPMNDTSILQQVQQKYRLPDSYIMYVGSLSPRKNVVRLLKAFAKISNKIPHNIVLTGSKSWKDSSVYRTVRELNLSHRIRLLGYVEREDMPALYNLASAYIYPSLYEGFGLPVLEAMQCGCPVVASSATSIPEVAGNAAILVDPLDVTAIAEATYKVLTDSKVREELTRLGFQQAKKFSWQSCAKTMLGVIRETAVGR